MRSLFRWFRVLAVGAIIAGGACVEDAGSGTDNAVESASDPIMQAQPEAPGEFAVFRNAEGGWQFHAVGEQGEIALFSQPYVERPSALNGILSVKDNGVLLERYQVVALSDGQYAIELKAANGQVIAESLGYPTQADATAAIEPTRELIAGILRYEAAVLNGARFELWRDGEWFFQLKSEDGRVLLLSEGYTGRTGAVNGIESVRDNGKNAVQYQVVESGGEASLHLYATNGQEIAVSKETYESVVAAEAGRDEIVALLQSERVGDPW